ncbi:MAG TPA: hypothetical protein VKM93_28105 [Terriglobia bacterium]|nr:hypothetical protein [Terriglobia bacterium]
MITYILYYNTLDTLYFGPIDRVPWIRYALAMIRKGSDEARQVMRGRWLVSVVAALFVVMPACAQTTLVLQYFNPAPGYKNGSTGAAAPGTFDGGFVGPYQAHVNGQKQITDVVCDDFDATIANQDYWDVSVYSPAVASNTIGSATDLKFSPGVPNPSTGQKPVYDPNITNPDLAPGGADGVPTTGMTQAQEYDMIGWLVAQIFADPTNSKGTWGALQGAIWSITDHGYSINACGPKPGNALCYTESFGGETAQGELALAANAVFAHGFVSTGLSVYTPLNGVSTSSPNKCKQNGVICEDLDNVVPNGPAQEMWVFTPEPSAVLLLAWGTLALAVGSLAKKKILSCC